MLKKYVFLRILMVFFLAASIFNIPLKAAPGPSPISDLSMNTTTPAVYDKFEAVFNLSTTYGLPDVFNPDLVDIMAYFTTPSGAV